MRIHVTGNAGSGKTTLANKLSEILDIPAYGLDNIVWKKGWEKSSLGERTVKETELVSKRKWIIEGCSSRIGSAADCVVFLDFPRRKCFLRCLRRNLPYLFRSRPGLPEKCPEIMIVPRLVKIIWKFPKNMKPSIEKHSQGKVFIRLSNSTEVKEFLRKLQHKKTYAGSFSPDLIQAQALLD